MGRNQKNHPMAKVEVLMPKMGESITEGSVVSWYKKEGDTIELDELLLEIGTDKVDTEIPSPSAGVIEKILTPEGETVPVGHVIALILTDTEEESTPAQTPDVSDSNSAVPPASEVEDTPVVMPKMGESITEGTVIIWHKQVGDSVQLDETLLEIGTDKVDTDVPAPVTGTLREILVPEGETVEVGTTIAVIGAENGVISAAPQAAPKSNSTPEAVPEPAPELVTDAVLEESAGPQNNRHLEDGRFLSPLVRSIAQTEKISRDELGTIKGSGRNGRITKKDVVSHLESRETAAPAKPKLVTVPPSPQPQPMPSSNGSSRVDVIKMDRMRQLIAEHMIESRRTAAHVTSFAEVDVTRLVQVREANKAAFLERDGVKLTYSPFLIYAAVEALREFPMLNSSVQGDQILLHKDYHIGMAVALQESGLIVPVIRHAGRLSISGLAHAASDLAYRARASELRPDDLQGGTFTLTNVGSLGSIMGTPIILQPQVAILATGTITKRPVVVEHPELGDTIAIRHMMLLSLSYDHRIIDGAMGIAFLRRFTEVIETLDPGMEL